MTNARSGLDAESVSYRHVSEGVFRNGAEVEKNRVCDNHGDKIHLLSNRVNRPSLTMATPVKLFLKTLLSFHLKEFFSFVFFRFLSSLHRRPRLVCNLSVGFSPTRRHTSAGFRGGRRAHRSELHGHDRRSKVGRDGGASRGQQVSEESDYRTLRRSRTEKVGPQRRARLPAEHICPSGQVFAGLLVCHSGS
jgi:hypothetical protein